MARRSSASGTVRTGHNPVFRTIGRTPDPISRASASRNILQPITIAGGASANPPASLALRSHLGSAQDRGTRQIRNLRCFLRSLALSLSPERRKTKNGTIRRFRTTKKKKGPKTKKKRKEGNYRLRQNGTRDRTHPRPGGAKSARRSSASGTMRTGHNPVFRTISRTAS